MAWSRVMVFENWMMNYGRRHQADYALASTDGQQSEKAAAVSYASLAFDIVS